MIIKKILIIVFLCGALELGMRASDEAVIVQELNYEKTDGPSKEFVDRYFRKFFIKDSKLHTALRCAMPVALMVENKIIFTYLLQSISSLRRCGIKKASLKNFLSDFLVASLFILGSNSLFLDFYLSEINREPAK